MAQIGCDFDCRSDTDNANTDNSLRGSSISLETNSLEKILNLLWSGEKERHQDLCDATVVQSNVTNFKDASQDCYARIKPMQEKERTVISDETMFGDPDTERHESEFSQVSDLHDQHSDQRIPDQTDTEASGMCQRDIDDEWILHLSLDIISAKSIDPPEPSHDQMTSAFSINGARDLQQPAANINNNQEGWKFESELNDEQSDDMMGEVWGSELNNISRIPSAVETGPDLENDMEQGNQQSAVSIDQRAEAEFRAQVLLHPEDSSGGEERLHASSGEREGESAGEAPPMTQALPNSMTKPERARAGQKHWVSMSRSMYEHRKQLLDGYSLQSILDQQLHECRQRCRNQSQCLLILLHIAMVQGLLTHFPFVNPKDRASFFGWTGFSINPHAAGEFWRSLQQLFQVQKPGGRANVPSNTWQN
eukprot:767388-Hanusia_phi.AAC.1